MADPAARPRVGRAPDHGPAVRRSLAGGKDLPGVEAWLDLVSAPLRLYPAPGAPGLDDPGAPMAGAELRELRATMRWTRRDLAAKSGSTDAEIARMEQDLQPVPGPLARWVREVSGPMRDHPLPESWEPRHAFVRPAAGRSALPRALPDGPRRRERQARAAAEAEAKQEREAARAERERRRREGEERRKAVSAEMERAGAEERRRLAAERARRAVELDDGTRTVEEIGWELGISHQAVSQILARRIQTRPGARGART